VTRIEHVILGAGPAGLQLAYYLKRAGRDYVVLEAGDKAFTFFERFPRHRKLLSINKRYTGYDDPELNLRWDWNSLLSEDADPLRLSDLTPSYFPDASDLVRYGNEYAERHELAVRYGVRVERVERGKNGGFLLHTADGEAIAAGVLVVATGLSLPYVPDVPGIEHAEPYTEMSVDPMDFAGQRVLVVGKGNSAFETADHLVETASLIHLASPHSVQMAWQTHFVGHLRAINNNILDTYQLKSQNALLDARLESIERRDDGKLTATVRYSHAQGEVEELLYDRVLVCTGFRFDDSIFAAGVRPDLCIDDRFPAQTAEWESTNVPGLFFGGALMQARDYKKTTSAFIHGFRYNMRCLFHVLEQRYHDGRWPRRHLADATADGLTSALLARINRTSALWQQFGYLADMVRLEGDGTATYLEEVPVDLVREQPQDGGLGDHGAYLLLTLEYGRHHQQMNPFAVDRVARTAVDQAEESNFLHPVVRLYRDRQQVAEHHVIEDLEAEWKEPEHIDPLRAFLEAEVAPEPASVA
jgi:thioredoxin reductase